MEELLKLLPNTALVTIIMLLVGIMLYVFKSEFKKFGRKLDIMHIDQQSMDYALEKNFANGYSKDRDKKRDELLDKKKYINEN